MCRIGKLFALFAVGLSMTPPLLASGAWGGQDLFHVPLSWCIVVGSPAQASPNVNGDTVTDDLIWRRHERPTDNIFVPQAGITFRSAINNAWTVLDFPQIADPDTTLGTPGDMRGEDVNVAGAEFNQMLADCDAAWAGLGRAGIGITAVNAGLFHDAAGTYVGTIGWGGCVEDVLNPGFCVSPWDGVITVVDNHYLFPTVPDRTFPDGSNLQFTLTDPMDQLVGHELGHALSLPHRSSATALMNPGPVDNVGGDGQSDNITLNATEVTAVRTRAQEVAGLEIDPPNVVLPGKVAALVIPDGVREERVASSLNLAAVKVTLDTSAGTATIGQRLFGPLSPKARQRHCFLLDTSAEQELSPAALRKIGLPDAGLKGADLAVCAHVRGRTVQGQAWASRDGKLVPVRDRIQFRLLALVMHPHYADIRGREPQRPKKDEGFVAHHIVTATLPAKLANLELGSEVRLEAQTFGRERTYRDSIRTDLPEPKHPFKLEHPSFPHCFPQGEPQPGETVKIVLEKLRPKRGIHGLLGPRLVFRGTTDEKGGGVIDFEIPKDTRPGPHLVTIGNDRTALTADCVVNVKRPQ